MVFFVLCDSSMNNAMPTSREKLEARSDQERTHIISSRTPTVRSVAPSKATTYIHCRQYTATHEDLCVDMHKTIFSHTRKPSAASTNHTGRSESRFDPEIKRPKTAYSPHTTRENAALRPKAKTRDAQKSRYHPSLYTRDGQTPLTLSRKTKTAAARRQV